MVNETSSSENEASSMEASASGCDDVARPTVLEDSDEDGTQQNPPERLNREPAINAAAPSAAQNKGRFCLLLALTSPLIINKSTAICSAHRSPQHWLLGW